jgi:hypothetical protein
MHFRQWKRREFISFLCGAATSWPLTARAQQAGRTYRVALVAGGVNPAGGTGPVMGRGVPALLDELRRLGFSEGQNLTMDYRSTNQPVVQFALDLAEMVRAKPDVIVTSGAEPQLLTTAKELLVGVLAGRLQRLIEVPDQGRSVERLGQKADRTGLEGARADAFVRESRDENDRQAPPFGDQAALQLDAAHAGHLDIGDQAQRLIRLSRPQEFVRRCKRMGHVSERPHEPVGRDAD